jgi:hypothetical protein
VVLAFQQIVDDTFDGVFDRRNSPRRWWRNRSFACSRADITLHNEHLGFLPAMMLASPMPQIVRSVTGALLLVSSRSLRPVTKKMKLITRSAPPSLMFPRSHITI